MKKLLTLFIMALIAVGTNAQILIDWEDYTIVPSPSFGCGNDQDCSVSSTSDGTAITIGPQVGYARINCLGNAALEANHNYIVRITAKFPCDGVLYIGLGDMYGSEQSLVANVVTTGDFQVVEVEFSDYAYSGINYGYVLINLTDVLGTTIIKRVEIIDEETPEPYDPSDICYNFIDKGKVAEVVSNPNKKYKGIVEIPSIVTHEGVDYTVIKIRESAFERCNTLTSVIIPNSVTYIGDYAFYYCTGLTSVTIPNSVTAIGYSAFRKCKGLTSITIPNGMTSIGNSAFLDCTGLTSITIPNSVTSIDNGAFSFCTGLTSVTIPNSVTSIGNEAFYGCRSLTSLTIPNSVTSIGKYAFHECSSLTSITIPNSVTSIGNSAFLDCTGLTSITIPNSVTSIGNSAFCHSGLTSVTIPNSVTSISAGSFGYCRDLTSVTIPNSVTSIGEYAFRECSSLTSVTIPNNVTSIGNGAFFNSGLTSVTIPNSVSGIGEMAYSGCNALTSVTIGSGVTEISSQAFANCVELTDVNCLSESVPSASSNAFDGSYPDYINLHVPEASVNLYRTTAPWSQFGTIESLSGNTPELLKCAKPSIAIENNKLTFSSETEGALFHYEITCADMKSGEASSVSLDQTYQISVYAYKEGYLNSDVTTMDLPLRCNGDMNNDGKVTITDVVNLIDAILTNP